MEFFNDLDHEEEAVQLAISNNKLVIQYLLNQQENQAIHGDSVPGRCFIHSDQESAHDRLFNDYFLETPKYNDILFQRRDTIGRLGLSSIQKVTVVFRMLAYGLPAYVVDEYIKIGESRTIESMKNFCRAIVEIFSAQYLRSPTPDDVSRLLYIGEKRGFPGMFGSLDCMHWKWKNCPTAWAGQYAGRSGSPTIILEVVADYDLWIWHAYFGLPGTNNDINVLESSHIFSNLGQGIVPLVHYVIQRKEYNMGYYLADGIYLKWSTIVQTIHEPDERDLDAPIGIGREAPPPKVQIQIMKITDSKSF
uniref:DDE Tnp4 domain-containing protein n=1 Tax=Brassica oleracea var. oleracea TaxID=109376 RepID=A0A0D3DBE3_BRAOL